MLEFRKHFKPHTVVHLGDFIDATAFRGGAKGTSDEAAPIPPDVEGGLDFLEKLQPQFIFSGNHEDRLYRLRHNPNAIVSHCANEVVHAIEDTAKSLRAEIIPYHIMEGWRKIGGYRYGHGYMYNVMATRDHAETVGNCVFAHTHTTGVNMGRRLDNPTGYNCGTLTRIENMDYAKSRRQTMGWSQGFVWGEYTTDRSVLWLHQVGRNTLREKWRLPL